MEVSGNQVNQSGLAEVPMSDIDLSPHGEQGEPSPSAGIPQSMRALGRDVGARLRTEPWHSVVRGAGMCALVAIAYWAVAPRTYRAQAIVAPSSRQGPTRLPSALSGLAGQLGLSAAADPTTTPAFYSLLGGSVSVRRDVLFEQIPGRGDEPGPRYTWMALGIRRCDSLCILRKGLRKLASDVDLTVDRETGTVTVSATLRDPYDAAAVANLYVEAMDRFNRRVRRTQARAGREFLESRVQRVTADLQTAEDALQTFYERNMGWRTSPRLTIEEGRLRRVIETRTELRSELVRQLEMARLDEVNSTPLLSVVDSASAPLWKHSPLAAPLILAAMVTGALVGLAIGIARLP